MRKSLQKEIKRQKEKRINRNVVSNAKGWFVLVVTNPFCFKIFCTSICFDYTFIFESNSISNKTQLVYLYRFAVYNAFL